MSYGHVVISSGHGLHVRGASSILDEVTEARKVVEAVAEKLRARGADVTTFHDDTSKDQSTNLETIVDFHNAHSRQLDISVHFNAFEYTETSGRGTETLYKSQTTLATQMSAAIAKAGELINRGPKLRHDLYFLNETSGPALLLEIAFCDSQVDADLYVKNFDPICEAIAGVLKHKEGEEASPSTKPLFTAKGKVSWFGGKTDEGVKVDEGLAFVYDIMEAPHLFLPYQPEGTTGLARRLNDEIFYLACRWSYDETPTEMLLSKKALVRVPGGIELTAFPSDWGPHSSTQRICDVSPGLMRALQIQTDDIVEVIFPAPED